MTKAWYFLTALALTLSLSACGGMGTSVPDSSATGIIPAESSLPEEPASLSAAESAEPEETESLAEESSLPEEAESPAEENAQETSPGGLDACTAHTPSYHSISGELMSHVGKEDALAWAESAARSNPEQMTILAFIEKFGIPKEQFIALTQGTVTDDYLKMLGMTREECYEEFGYTDQQIDALYSGDQAAVDRAFCGKLALFNEADGQLYTIGWLAEHTAEDYLAAGFPLEEVDAILENTSIPGYDDCAGLAEVIAPVLEEAKALK